MLISWILPWGMYPRQGWFTCVSPAACRRRSALMRAVPTVPTNRAEDMARLAGRMPTFSMRAPIPRVNMIPNVCDDKGVETKTMSLNWTFDLQRYVGCMVFNGPLQGPHPLATPWAQWEGVWSPRSLPSISYHNHYWNCGTDFTTCFEECRRLKQDLNMSISCR